MRMIFIVLLLANIAFLIFHLASRDVREHSLDSRGAVELQGKKLQTVAEREKNKVSTKGSQGQAPETVHSLAVEGTTDRCQLIGPFAELLHAEYLVERLAGLEVAAVVRHVEVADGKAYWIYLKPEMSEKEALRRLYEIQAKAIDSYIIPSGELTNGISFGQFSDEKDAQKKAEQIRGQGYAVEIKEIPKSHSEVWVEIKESNEQKISEEQWLGLLKEEKGIERRKNYCLGVAN